VPDLNLNKKVAIIVIGVILILVAFTVLFQIAVNFISPSAKPHTTSTEEPKKTQPAVEKPADDNVIKSAEAVISQNPESAKSEDAYWRLAAAYDSRHDLLKTKETYQKLIDRFPSSPKISDAQSALEDVNVKLLFSDLPTDDSFIYVVQKGDNLVKIAKKFSTTVELISKSNGLQTDFLRYGKKLKITKHKFSIVVDKSQNILTLKADGNLFKTYNVSTGKNSCTPVGTFTIITKIVDPPWYPPKGKVIMPGDPKNVLGSRWLGISKQSYGIHGTIDPQSIGKSVTEGCVRMRNNEVEELFAIVPEGTEVVIVD
jgi:lipoprotein-anchoring transpeptidase ErfK/SrfK